MIIAGALGVVFQGIVQPYQGKDYEANYHYGDQLELVKWVIGKGEATKYPLIWYVLSPFTESNGWYVTTGRIILLQNTIETWFNNKRRAETYKLILDPLSKKVIDRLKQNPYIQIQGDISSKFRMKDQPLHGIGDDSFSRKDFGQTGSGEANESVAPDFVDTRIIEFDFRIKADCIN